MCHDASHNILPNLDVKARKLATTNELKAGLDHERSPPNQQHRIGRVNNLCIERK